MKQLLCTVACCFLVLNASAATPKSNYANKGAVTLYFSQGFQGPEKWEKHTFKVDKKGFINIFDGKTLRGWRGYGKTYVPSRWVVDNGSIHFIGNESPESKGKEGGDLVFAHKFKNFELDMEWKVGKGANSGIFYLAQETVNEKGELQPIYISCPECQVLDNENHPDAKLGVDGNRKSSSLYDMIPAKPQNAKPYGQWNHVKIRVLNGTVTHFQNGVQVLQYKLWTPEWTELLQKSKFSEKAWPIAFRFLNDCGGANREGLIGIQDHGNDVWFRNIRVKEL